MRMDPFPFSWKMIPLSFLLGALAGAPAAEVTLRVSDPAGAAARVSAPVSVRIDLASTFGKEVDPLWLRLLELIGAERNLGPEVPVQFVADRPPQPSGVGEGTDPSVPGKEIASSPVPGGASPGRPEGLTGMLWWLMPPGEPGERWFRLTVADSTQPLSLAVQATDDGKYYEIADGPQPVLRYNFGNVPVPAGTPAHFAAGESYERGDYISPLYGPDGEVLTEDYPVDHPHHRGVWWSWPVTRWREEVFDIWAVVGVHARPVTMHRAEAGPVMAVLEPENLWKWKGQEPIVREEVTIRAFRQVNRGRTVDVEVRLTALVEGVAIGGRPHAGYGGFTLRAAPCQERQITLYLDPDPTPPRRAWIDYSGLFAGGQGPSGVAIFEDLGNPDYPNPQQQYPDCNCVMPAFPAEREVSLPPGQTLVLKHRLWIHPGQADENQLAAVWSAYAHPPQVIME